MYIQNRRGSSKFNACSPLQNRIGLIGLKPAIAYFAYTKRYALTDKQHCLLRGFFTKVGRKMNLRSPRPSRKLNYLGNLGFLAFTVFETLSAKNLYSDFA